LPYLLCAGYWSGSLGLSLRRVKLWYFSNVGGSGFGNAIAFAATVVRRSFPAVTARECMQTLTDYGWINPPVVVKAGAPTRQRLV